MKLPVIRYILKIVLLLIIVEFSSGCATLFPPVKPRTFLTGKDIGVAVLSPDNKTIVFSLGSTLHKVDLNGTNRVTLDNGSISNFDPRFSPDGSKILFCHVSEGQGDICTINLDGSGRVCLTSGAEHDYEPVYSPDGSLIYFLRAQVFRNYSPIALPAWHDVDIYSIRADGSGLKRITFQNNYGMSNLSINSTGNTLMVRGFESETENIRPIWMIPINEPKNIKTIEPDLTNYRYKRLLLGPEKVNYAELSNPQFSPDGTHMLFTWPNRRNLFLMNIKRNLTEKIWTWESDKAQLGGMYPRFSQDGHQIIFSTVHLCEKCDVRIPWPRKETEIWLIYTDGTGLRSVEIK